MLTPGFLYQKRIPLDCTTGSVFSAYGGKKEYNRLGNARSTVVPKKYAYSKGFVQDCSNSIANALELLQFCTKSLINGLSFGFCCGQVPGTKWYLGWYQMILLHLLISLRVTNYTIGPMPVKQLSICIGGKWDHTTPLRIIFILLSTTAIQSTMKSYIYIFHGIYCIMVHTFLHFMIYGVMVHTLPYFKFMGYTVPALWYILSYISWDILYRWYIHV